MTTQRWKVFAVRCRCGCNTQAWYAHGPELVGLRGWTSLPLAHEYATLASRNGGAHGIAYVLTLHHQAVRDARA